MNLTKFDQLKADIQIYVAPLRNIIVNSKESQDVAMTTARELAFRAKRIEDLRKELKAPYVEAGKEIDAYAKSIDALLTNPINEVKIKLLFWNKELENVRQIEVARIKKEEQLRQAAADKKAKEDMEAAAFEKEISGEAAGEVAELTVIAKYERTEASAAENMRAALSATADIRVKGVTLRWDFNIVNVADIPLKYMMPNLVLIRKDIVDSKGALNIPGVEAFQTESMSIR